MFSFSFNVYMFCKIFFRNKFGFILEKSLFSYTSEARNTPSATTSATTEFYGNSPSPINIFPLMAAAICGGAANAAIIITSEARNTPSAITCATTEFYNKSHSFINIFPSTAAAICGGSAHAATSFTSEARNTPSGTTSGPRVL